MGLTGHWWAGGKQLCRASLVWSINIIIIITIAVAVTLSAVIIIFPPFSFLLKCLYFSPQVLSLSHSLPQPTGGAVS